MTSFRLCTVCGRWFIAAKPKQVTCNKECAVTHRRDYMRSLQRRLRKATVYEAAVTALELMRTEGETEVFDVQ